MGRICISLSSIADIVYMYGENVTIRTLSGDLLYSGKFNRKVVRDFGDYIVTGVSAKVKLIFTDDSVFDGYNITVRG